MTTHTAPRETAITAAARAAMHSAHANAMTAEDASRALAAAAAASLAAQGLTRQQAKDFLSLCCDTRAAAAPDGWP